MFEKFIFASFSALVGSIFVAMLFGWLKFIYFSPTWCHIILILDVIILFVISIAEANASETKGASGFILFGFITFNLVLAVLLSIIQGLLWLLQLIF